MKPNKLSLTLAGACVLLTALSGCERGQVKAASNDTPAPTVESVADTNLVSVAKPEQFSLAKVLGRAESDQLVANGIVAADVSRTVPVNALSSGRVVDIRARLGDDVKQGQILLTMTSPDMSQAFSDYSKFQADEALAKTQSERTELLLSKGAIAQKEVEVAQDTYSKAKIDTKTAAEHIRILGGDPEHPSPLIEIHAPVSGTIIEQNVTSASGIKSQDNSPNLFTIADLSTVWVICDVFENDLAKVHVGDRAQIELSAYPNRRLRGRSPISQSCWIRIRAPLKSGLKSPMKTVSCGPICSRRAFRLARSSDAHRGSGELRAAASRSRLGFR